MGWVGRREQEEFKECDANKESSSFQRIRISWWKTVKLSTKKYLIKSHTLDWNLVDNSVIFKIKSIKWDNTAS